MDKLWIFHNFTYMHRHLVHHAYNMHIQLKHITVLGYMSYLIFTHISICMQCVLILLTQLIFMYIVICLYFVIGVTCNVLCIVWNIGDRGLIVVYLYITMPHTKYPHIHISTYPHIRYSDIRIFHMNVVHWQTDHVGRLARARLALGSRWSVARAIKCVCGLYKNVFVVAQFLLYDPLFSHSSQFHTAQLNTTFSILMILS